MSTRLGVQRVLYAAFRVSFVQFQCSLASIRALKAPNETYVGKRRRENAWFLIWFSRRLGKNKSKHVPRNDLSPLMCARIISSVRVLHITDAQRHDGQSEYNTRKASVRENTTTARPWTLENGSPNTCKVKHESEFASGLRTVVMKVGSFMCLPEKHHATTYEVSRVLDRPAWFSVGCGELKEAQHIGQLSISNACSLPFSSMNASIRETYRKVVIRCMCHSHYFERKKSSNVYLNKSTGRICAAPHTAETVFSNICWSYRLQYLAHNPVGH